MNNVLCPFFAELPQEQKIRGFCRQESAVPNVAPVRFEALQEVFEGRMVTRGLWPPRPPDLTPRDFYVSKRKRLSPVHAVHHFRAATFSTLAVALICFY